MLLSFWIIHHAELLLWSIEKKYIERERERKYIDLNKVGIK